MTWEPTKYYFISFLQFRDVFLILSEFVYFDEVGFKSFKTDKESEKITNLS